MFTTINSGRAPVTLICVMLVLFLFLMIGCSSKSISDLRQQLQQSKNRETQARNRADKLEKENSQLKNQVADAEEAENQAKDQVEQARNRADRLEKKNSQLENRVADAKEAENQAKDQVEQARNRADRLEKKNSQLKKLNEDLEDKIALVPRADIETVRYKIIRTLRKKGIEISGRFWVSNRKGHKVEVIALFYYLDGIKWERLKTKNQGKAFKGQVAVKQAFTPKDVEPLKAEFEIFMPFKDLNVLQSRTLKYEVRIYDETTEQFLEEEPYSEQFRYNP